MIYLEWFFTGLIICTGFVGGYFVLMLISNLEKQTFSTIFCGEWILDPDVLNEKGKYYRKAIFGCWILIAIAIFIVKKIT